MDQALRIPTTISANVSGLSAEKVVVRNAYVGGAFGQALRPKYQLFLAVMASLDLKRSMKVEMSRREMFYLTWRPTAKIVLPCNLIFRVLRPPPRTTSEHPRSPNV